MASSHTIILFALLQLPFYGVLSRTNATCPGPCQCFSITTMICSDDQMMALPADIPPQVRTLIVVASSVGAVAFREEVHLTKLVLLNNPVNMVSSHAFEQLTGLEELEISGSPLMAIESGAFQTLCKLSTLLLNNNKLKILPPGILDVLQRLQTLQLRGNGLQYLGTKHLHNLHNLQHLDLSFNQLPSATLQLRILSLRGNQVTNLPQGIFTQLKSLEELNLRDNRVSELSAGVFPGSLKKLVLRGNGLVQLPSTAFGDLRYLTHLDLSHNRLSTIPAELLQNLSSLEYFSISANQISELHGTSFQGLLNLKTIHLQANNLSFLEADLFKDQEEMSRLFLSRNRLQSLPYGFFESFGIESLVQLHDNPWHCNCSLLYLREWLEYSSGAVEEVSQILCFSPEPVRGKRLASLGKDQLVCTNSSEAKSRDDATGPTDVEISTSAASKTKHCSLQDINGTLVIKCRLMKCSNLKVETHFHLVDGSTFTHMQTAKWPKHTQCLSGTVTLTV
uniref:LRRCT domain-containing protein n=1 Tax=Electrophorus electricus TaxID=8005 RepID=A0A4W4HJQ2_ELEEL